MKSSATLKAELNSLTGKRDNLKIRLKDLKKIKRTLYTDFDSCISTINSNESSASNGLMIGLEGLSNVSTVRASIEKLAQKSTETDGNMSTVLENIQNEIKRIEDEIDDYDSQIKDKNADIKIAKEAESASK